MRVITELDRIRWDGPSVLTLGKFDGLHRGHRTLIDRVLEKSRETGFSPLVLTLGISRDVLLTKEEKRQLLSAEGVEGHIECPFVPAVITMEAADFVRELLVGRLHIRHLVVGEDFRFGCGRRGDTALLESLGRTLGFTVEILPKLREKGEVISSSRIRELLAEGRMEEVEELLGYPYFVTGEILHGRRVGRTIGFPTTNLIPGPEKLLPPRGVYFVRSEAGGRTYSGLADIGTKPTVDGGFVGVEAHLFGLEEEIYGKWQKVELLHFSRSERKFPDLAALRGQISLDLEKARKYFKLN